MIYNDSTNKLGIINDIATWCFGSSSNDDTTAYPLADKTRNANAWYDRVVSLIMKADNRWEFDDINQTDLPIATTALVANQQNYGLNAAVHYKILRVEILDSNGNGQQLNPISQDDKTGTAMTEYQETAGTPEEYDLVGNSIFLYPKPSYAYTAGLKIYFQRGASYFASGDTTKTPGFNEMFHRIISLGASLDWISINNSGSNKIPILTNRIKELEEALINFYSGRHRSKTKMSLGGKDDFQVIGYGYVDENSVG